MTTSTDIDPHGARMYLDLRFEEENWDEDMSGKNGPEAKRRAKAMLAKAVKAAKTAYSSSEAFTDLVMGLEDRAAEAVFKKLGKTRNRSNSTDSYDIDGNLSIFIPIDTVADVRRVRALLDREGRSYDFAPYITANGVALFPQGVNGPIFKTEGSVFLRGDDLDDWLDAQPVARKKAAKPRARR